ncbi:MAG: hypothetical protein SOX75_09565 [Candidatus Limivicinus sp.]|nr:hypothetical protein [Candidatus Limivicinus sp.]
MTVVEKAAYLKGLTEGLGIAPDSKEGKLWNALNELLSDMAHEIEDLHACYDEHDEALDEVCDELNYLEELTCDLDFPEDDDDYDDEDEDDDGEPEYDGVIYDATCPVCGEEISFDEDTLAEGSIECPNCGEKLEFDLGDDDKDEDKE